MKLILNYVDGLPQQTIAQNIDVISEGERIVIIGFNLVPPTQIDDPENTNDQAVA